jgi:hypothetical protein
MDAEFVVVVELDVALPFEVIPTVIVVKRPSDKLLPRNVVEDIAKDPSCVV